MNNFFRQLLFGIDNYNINQQFLINTKKDNIITKIYIFRKPINSILKQTLNILSFGQFIKNLKKSPYDDIFHLYIVVKLDDNSFILIEKNERINIKYINNNDYLNLIYNKNVQKLEILNIEDKIRFIDLLNNTYLNMGSNYFKYTSNEYNCQNFIFNILMSNYPKILNNNIEIYKFIYQDPSYFFQKLNYLTLVNNIITNIGSKIDLIKRGSGINDNNINKVIINNKKYKYNSNKNKKKFIKIIDDDIIIFYDD